MNILLAKNLPNGIDTTNYVGQFNNEKIKYLGGISKVNVFVGANNSGKSRFIRGLLKLNGIVLFSNKYKDNIELLTTSFFELSEKIPEIMNLSIYYSINNNYPDLIEETKLLKSNFKSNNSNQLTLSFNKSFALQNSNFFNEILLILDKDNIEKANNQLRYLKGFLLIIKGIFDDFPNVNRTKHFKGMNVHINNFNITIKPYALEFINKVIVLIDGVFLDNVKIIDQKKIYIPTLRSAKTLVASGQDNQHIYKETILNTYFKDVENFNTTFPLINIYTGLDFYSQVKKVRNSKKDIRRSFDKFELFLKKNFFNEKEVDIVALDDEKHLSFYLDDEDLEIHELGDGIQAIIVLMFPIFTAEKDSWIFIDEPEINLHPGMQRLFFHQILNNSEIKKKNLRFFITTHSNHFLDLTIPNENVSIFSFSKLIGSSSKEHKFLIRNVKPVDTLLLSELGVNNSSVFLANCSIWIEGVSDRKYLSAFLLAYLKSINKEHFLREDVDYAFFEYSGSNLSHYLFSDQNDEEEREEVKKLINAFALSNRIYLLADKDGDNKKSKHTFLNSISKINENFCYQNTGAIEVENILSFSVLKKIIINVFKQDSDIISKIDNIVEKDYKDIRLGEFLNKRLNSRKGIELPKITDDGKTINSRYKLKMANYLYDEVLANRITWNMINENNFAKKITIDIYKFILKYKDKN